jgi:hypothetical protein
LGFGGATVHIDDDRNDGSGDDSESGVRVWCWDWVLCGRKGKEGTSEYLVTWNILRMGYLLREGRKVRPTTSPLAIYLLTRTYPKEHG